MIGKGNRYPYKRNKIIVRPAPPADYKSRLEARCAWAGGRTFLLVTSEGTSSTQIDARWASDPHNKIGEVTIQFDEQRQGIVVKIPPPTQAQLQEVLARASA